MARREPVDRPGSRCTRRAARGRWGRARSPVWVEVMASPFGRVTLIGCKVGWTSTQGPSIIKKWWLAPVSAMTGGDWWGGEELDERGRKERVVGTWWAKYSLL